jgi:hypothetical protein
VLVRQIGDEHRLGRGGAFGIEPADSAITGDPNSAVAGLNQIVDLGMGQPIARGKAGEAVTIEAGETFVSAEPQEASGILANAVDVIMGEPVGRGVNLDRQLLGPDVYRDGCDQMEESESQALHDNPNSISFRRAFDSGGVQGTHQVR